MDIVKNIIEFFFQIDKHLDFVIQHYGTWSYGVIFAIIFAETGLVVTPFLPGDSLLFAAGTFAAIGSFNLFWISFVIFAAAVIGDSVNYAIGKKIGEDVFKKESRFFKKEYLDKTHAFYEKYGGKTIILARFIPVVRTFAPFVAGVGKMNYGYFFCYNVVGAVLWVVLLVGGGFVFGNMPLIRDNFSIAIFVIVVLSILPAIIEYVKHHKRKG